MATWCVESFCHAAKTMLAHFHFVCKGYVPLALDWDSREVNDLAILDAEQTQYMKKMKQRVGEKGLYSSRCNLQYMHYVDKLLQRPM